jgi:glycosyltransferase involved in cell wall biosynthesis
MSLTTEQVLAGLSDAGLLAGHLETRDDRSVHNMGRLDLRNVVLGLLHAFQFLVLLVRARPDFVYVPISQNRLGFLRDSTFLLAARLTRRRTVVHLNGGYFGTLYAEADPLTRLLVRASLSHCEQAWALSPRLERMFEGVVPPSRVTVVENAVEDVNGQLASAGSANPAAADRLRVLYLSNLVPEKGCFDLLAALERLGEAATRISVAFVGDAPVELELQLRESAARVEALGAELEFPGIVTGEDKHARYRESDLFVYPTHYPFEGQPLVLLEAMAAGLPIVTTRHAAIPETLEDGEHALLVAPRDPDALAAAIVRLLDDPELRERLGRAARARYEERYRPEHLRGRVVGLFRDMAAARG